MEAAKYSPPCVPGHVAKQQLRYLSSIKGRYFWNEKSRETGGRRRDMTSTCSPTPGCQKPSQRWKEATVQSRKAEQFTARWKRKVDLLPFAPSCSKPCSSSRPGSGARSPTAAAAHSAAPLCSGSLTLRAAAPPSFPKAAQNTRPSACIRRWPG